MSKIYSELRLVDINRLKQWAFEYLEVTSHLRAVLSLEKDLLTSEEFLVKMDTWIKLAELEASSTSYGRGLNG